MSIDLKKQISNVRRWAVINRRLIYRSMALTLLLFVIVLGIWLVSTYTYYAAILDKELANHSLKVPAGIYAAPRHINKGAPLTRDDLVERLVRAGYQEGAEANEFAAGNFVVQNDTIEIATNDFNHNKNLPARVRLGLKNNAVAEIKDLATNQSLKTVWLPAELLTADLNTKQQVRSATSFDELPPVLIRAVCAIEDRNFFAHDGIDSRAIMRAFFKNFFGGGIREGGSTLTQQLIKNQFLSAERTYERKLAEAMMAMALEHRLSKEQIFALYCDRVYLGQSGSTSIYGFKQAARVFYGKELREITISEAALLAGIIKAPNRYSPHLNPQEAAARRDTVLDAMVETAAINDTEAASAKSNQIALLPPQRLDATAAPHFVDYVRREMEQQPYDDETASHLRVETTLDLDLQEAANTAVTSHLDKLDKVFKKRATKPEAGLVALDPHTGEVLAMVGGRNYASSQLNRVTDARRQPGSVFKPVIYAAAMSEGLSPMTLFLNAPHEIQYGYKAVYNPENFGHSYSNTDVTLREAMVRSLNIVAVDAAMRVGLGTVAEVAGAMGLEQSHTYPSMALGTSEATPLEIARAYTTFANDGQRTEPVAIRSMNLGGESSPPTPATKRRVISPQMAYVVTETLAEVVNRGTAAQVRGLGYKGPAAGKTGTSRDAWFAGYTPNLLVVVWVGFDNNDDIGMTGGEAAVPIWTEFVKRALALRPDLAAERFDKPAGLETIEIDPETGMIANEYCLQRQKVALPAYLMPGICYLHQEQLAVAEFPELDPDAVDSTLEVPDEDIHDKELEPQPLPDGMKIPVSTNLPKPPPPPPPNRRNQ